MSRKILVRVAAPAVITGLALMAACLVSVWYLNHLQANLATLLKEEVAVVRAAEQMEINIRQVRFLCFRYLIAPSDELRGRIGEAEGLFLEWLAKAELGSRSDREIATVKQIRDGYDQHQEEFARLSEKVSPTNPRRDFQKIVDTHLAKNVIEPCRTLLQENVVAMNATAEESNQVTHNLRLAMIILGVVGPLGGLVCGYGIARGLSRSLYRLSVRVQDMAQRFDTEVTSVKLGSNQDDGLIQGIVRQVEQVTQRIQKQQQDLIRAEQLATVGKLAACVAHEIRNPLAAMKLLVSIALRPRNPKSLTDEDLRVIHDEIGRLEHTAQNLLDFARLPAPQRSRCDLRDVVQQAADLVGARADLQKVSVNLHLPLEPVEVEVDRSQWSTVLINLFLNALDAMPDGGRLEVSLDHNEASGIQLRVADTGFGIPAERQEELFAPFTSSKASGTGLGLTISKRVVEDHGGRLNFVARDSMEGSGACFLISLPQKPNGHHAKTPDHR